MRVTKVANSTDQTCMSSPWASIRTFHCRKKGLYLGVKEVSLKFEGCLTVRLPHEIM